MTRYPDHAVRADPVGCARGALAALREAERLIVHFDVDAVDSGDLPLANFPHYGTGVPLAVARQVLSVLFAAPALSTVVLTEVNPSYDPSGDSLDRYLEGVTGALITGLAGSHRRAMGGKHFQCGGIRGHRAGHSTSVYFATSASSTGPYSKSSESSMPVSRRFRRRHSTTARIASFTCPDSASSAASSFSATSSSSETETFRFAVIS